jgi:hypothetical protein
MEEKIVIKRSELTEKDENPHFGFKVQNYRLLIIGLAINVLGFLLMIGGGSDDPNKFDANELFSFQRITLSPILIIAGYIVILYSIMKRPSKK